ncbi:MAG: MFS transporter [Kineosporiaceae bacterium]
MTAASSAGSLTSVPVRPPARPGAVLAVLIGAQLLIWIDNTILNVALKTLADPVSGLAATPEQLEWSLNSYTLTFAACMLAGGALGDRVGRRTTFMAGLVVFGAASGWAAWSTTPESLIAARAVMGLGSALVVPSTLGLIRSVFPEGPQRSRAVALWSAASGLAIAIGPLLGGLLLERFWWGSIFLVNVPVVLVALVAARVVVPEAGADRDPAAPPAPRVRLDIPGVLLSATGLGLLVWGTIEGGRLGDWTAVQVWVPMLLGVLVLAVFTLVEVRSRTPGFDLALFGDRAFAAAGVGVALSFFGLVGSMYYSIFYLQGVRGLSPLECGVVLVPVAVGVLVGAPSGMVLAARVGPRVTAAPAVAVVALTLLGYAGLAEDTSLWLYAGLLLVQGLAVGAATAPLTDAVVTVLPRDRAAGGAALNAVLRQVGAVLGVAVLGSLLAATYRSEVAPVTEQLPAPLAEAVDRSAEAGRPALAEAGLERLVPALDAAYLTAMHTTTVLAAAVALLGAVVVGVAMPGRRAWAAARESAAREPVRHGPVGQGPTAHGPGGHGPTAHQPVRRESVRHESPAREDLTP